MRLGDLDDLKEVINDLFRSGEYDCNSVLKAIDNAPTIEPFERIGAICNENCGYKPQGEWIPVSERLPEEKLFNPSGSDFGFEEVLCTNIWGNVRAYKFGKPIGHDKPHFWLGGRMMDEYVIAWQSLPEPYQKGGAGNGKD